MSSNGKRSGYNKCSTDLNSILKQFNPVVTNSIMNTFMYSMYLILAGRWPECASPDHFMNMLQPEVLYLCFPSSFF